MVVSLDDALVSSLFDLKEVRRVLVRSASSVVVG